MRQVRTSIAKIVEAQHELVAELVECFGDFDPAIHCWGCGEERKLFRAHIIPHSAGGPDEGSNYFMLCRTCHREQPDNASLDAQRRWLLDREPRGFRALYWLFDNVCKPLLVRAEQLAPTMGGSLLAAWLDSLGETHDERQAAFSLIANGEYGQTGSLTMEGRLNTAKYELFAAFEEWTRERSRSVLVASLSTGVARAPSSPEPEHR